jgi:hypothetical protein
MNKNCLSGDTKISLLDNTEVEIKDLVGREEFFVYSYDLETNKIVVGRGHSARKTKYNAPVVEITLDNGEKFKCTFDHPLLKRDGSGYVNAINSLNCSIMPLYRKLSEEQDDKRRIGYEMVLNVDSGRYEFTHCLSDEYNIENSVYSRESGHVRHHINFNKRDNTPQNVIRMKWGDHFRFHSERMSGENNPFYGKLRPEHSERMKGENNPMFGMSHSKETKIRLSKLGEGRVPSEKTKLKMSKSHEGKTHSEKTKIKMSKSGEGRIFSDEHKRRISKSRKEKFLSGELISPMNGKHHSKKTKERLSELNAGENHPMYGKSHSKETLAKMSEVRKRKFILGELSTVGEKNPMYGKHHSDATKEKMRESKRLRSQVLKEAQIVNHKVVFIKDCGFEDVYDITVDKYENFAISVGIFVHNSPEVSLMIETLVEEAISYKLTTGELVEIEVFDEHNDLDKETTEFINDAIDLLNPNTEVIVRGMALFGDHFVEPLGISQKHIKSLRCETDPKRYKRTNFEESSAPLKYEYKLRDQKTKILYPWEVIHYKIPTGDEEYFPYGISSADACRSPYRRLLVLEGLLALARAAKTDKLVVRIPTGTNNPEAAMAKLSRARAMWHDIIFGSGKEVRGVKKPDAFTEVLWLPEGSGDQRIGLERLTSTIDFTTTEDVEYFLDKLISATGMPRSYFKPDEKYQGYKKLTLQDLRFSRKVAKVVKSYSYGHIVLASIILALNSRWTEGTSLAAKYRQITPVADEQLNSMRVALDNISTMSNYFITLTGRPNLSDLAVKTLLIRYLDLDPETIDLMIQTSPRAVPEIPLPGVDVPPDMPKENLDDRIYRILTEMLETSTIGRFERTYSKDVPEVNDIFKTTTGKLTTLIEATGNRSRDDWEKVVKTVL